MSHGGYVVLSDGNFERGYSNPPLFASTTIDEALGFIRDKLKPQASTPVIKD